MFTTTTSDNRPLVLMQNEAIEIREGNKKLRLSLNEISKMCLRPCKNSSFSRLLGTVLSIHERMYNFCITTIDGREIQIRINGHHKQVFVSLISHVRHNLRKPTSALPGLN